MPFIYVSDCIETALLSPLFLALLLVCSFGCSLSDPVVIVVVVCSLSFLNDSTPCTVLSHKCMLIACTAL